MSTTKCRYTNVTVAKSTVLLTMSSTGTLTIKSHGLTAVLACLASIPPMLRNIKSQLSLIPMFFKALQILHGIGTQIRHGRQIKFTLLGSRQLHDVLECITSPIALSLQLFQLQFTWSFWQCWVLGCGNNGNILWFRWLIEKPNHAQKSNNNSPPNCIVRHGEYINNAS